MQKAIRDLYYKFTSRKFLLTLAAALVLYANKQWTELVLLISGYMGIEGVADAVERYRAPDSTKAVEATKQQAIQHGLVPAGVSSPQLVAGE